MICWLLVRIREPIAVDTLQAALTRITNAEAVSISPIASVIGVGATEVPRKILSPEDIQTIIRQEIEELTQAHASMAAYSGHHMPLR